MGAGGKGSKGREAERRAGGKGSKDGKGRNRGWGWGRGRDKDRRRADRGWASEPLRPWEEQVAAGAHNAPHAWKEQPRPHRRKAPANFEEFRPEERNVVSGAGAGAHLQRCAVDGDDDEGGGGGGGAAAGAAAGAGAGAEGGEGGAEGGYGYGEDAVCGDAQNCLMGLVSSYRTPLALVDFHEWKTKPPGMLCREFGIGGGLEVMIVPHEVLEVLPFRCGALGAAFESNQQSEEEGRNHILKSDIHATSSRRLLQRMSETV
ncbi:hypothetical protein AXG93_4295s1930 [Marchantia polymorpha subsp. ruderalis]|uniref:Uncharacterized protein n=1 Tax=Marchantia polymorpha subsp. ruderalis TaxID=1480154 RepID=A0A176WAT6_MARPO|nr:hypothetical protein AXG93_4295s1930 [Marchantia polymorpha subsp. ruderalis]